MLTLIWGRLEALGLMVGAHMDRLADNVERAKLRVIDRAADLQMLNLRVGEDLVDRVDRAARHAGFAQLVDPEFARL